MLVLTVSVGRRVYVGENLFQLVSLGRYGTATFTYGGHTHTLEEGESIGVAPDCSITYCGKCPMHSKTRRRFGFAFPRSIVIVREEAMR